MVKRVKAATLARKTVGERRRYENALAKARKARYRAKFTREEKRAMRKADLARCCDLDWLRSMCEVDPKTGCWHWQGPWRRVFEQARPEARRGTFGSMDARRAAFLASRGKAIPAHCWVRGSCGHEDCLAPDHLRLLNQALVSAEQNHRSRAHGTQARQRAAG